MSSWLRIAVLGGACTLSLSASARAEVSWDNADPARGVLESLKSAAADPSGLSNSEALIVAPADGCWTARSGAQPADCLSATPADDSLVIFENPPVIHRKPAHSKSFAVAPSPVAIARIETIAPIANVLALSPRWMTYVAPSSLPFLAKVEVLHVR
jgi:hypothetical protein